MKDTLTSLLLGLLYIIGIGDYGIGVVHSFNKHGIGDGIIGMVAFPWAMYRGVEYWWHDDYADVDWDKRLKTDMLNSVYFINEGNNSEANQFQLNEDIEKFSSKIKDYPSEKKQFLIDGTRKYIQYSQSMAKDMMNSFNKYFTTENFDIVFSAKTKALEKDLTDYKLQEDIAIAKKGIEEINNQMKENISKDTVDVDFEKMKSDYESSFKLLLEKQEFDFKRIFKALFDEEL